MQALIEVGAFFAFLHVIAKASVSHESHLPVLSPRELLKYRCHSPRLIDRAKFSIGSGLTEFDPELYLSKDHQDHQRFYLAALVASDVLLRNLRKNPGHLQLMFNELQLTLDIKRDFAKKGVSTEASREELMQETLFALTETIRRRDRYNVAK